MITVNPRIKTVLYVVGALAVLAAISVSIWYLLKPRYNLEATFVNSESQIDGKLNEAAWAKTKTLTVPTEKGPDIELKALYTSDRIFISARYPDATKDAIHQPWLFDGKIWNQGRKTDGLVYFFASGDSVKDFDTKGFGVMDPEFGVANDIYQFSITGKKSASGYWPGYQGRADIWIMGAGLTSFFGQADDAWFGVDNNYLLSPASRVAQLFTQWDEFTTPGTIKLNVTRWQEAIKVSEGGNADALTRDQPYLMYSDKTMNLGNTPYPTDDQLTPISGNAVFSKGDTLPFIYFNSLSPGHWGGSRDDVAGKMTWKDGWWTVEMSRKLKTGNQDDIVFRTGDTDTNLFGVVVRRDGKFIRYTPPATLTFLPKGGE